MSDEKVWSSGRRLSTVQEKVPLNRAEHLPEKTSLLRQSERYRLATMFCSLLMLLWQNASYTSGSWFPLCGQADQLLLRKRRQTRKPVNFACVNVTVWSKASVTNNISLRSLKIAKNGLTKWFLESFYAAVLVFWCLKIIRRKKCCISLVC